MKASIVIAALSGLASASTRVPPRSPAGNCRCLPGDECWPSTSAWGKFNSTVSGRLIATAPLGSVCHEPNYDEAKCAAVRAKWTNPELHIVTTSSPMEPFFANQSCDPFTDKNLPCTLGNLVSYSVNVSTAAHVQAALKFAQQSNIRVNIRNTGHDFLGRSTGAGALSIWTHNLQNIDFIDWKDAGAYEGPAVKVAAGVQGWQVTEAAHAKGLVVVGGECPTVGLAGGYIQGGGHSALSTSFGLAADSALEFEVVLASGKIVKANRKSNTDLFWALRGGGGGTYGVVMSVTVAAYPNKTVGGAFLSTASSVTTPEKWTQLISRFHGLIPNMTDAGASVVYYASSAIFAIRPVTVYDANKTYVQDVVMKPVTDLFAELGIPYQGGFTELSYRDHYDRYMGPLPTGWITIASFNFGGRLIPRDVLADPAKLSTFNTALGKLHAGGVLAVGTAAAYNVRKTDIGATPVWRTTAVQMQLTTPWANQADWTSNLASQERMTKEFMPTIEAATPGGGSYLNEADFNQPNWQEAFFGANYARLRDIKCKYDPFNVLYILKGVGSDGWNVAADGRMCRA
ncbi:hypothetical protein RB601_005990 [Gaeumannomyces tritici]